MDEKQFVPTLLDISREAGLSLSEEQARLCFEHVRLMIEWNRRVNLTRITDLHEIIVKHLLDSFIPSRWLPKSGYALDVGTGPGFPGIPLKILHPDLQMVLLETHRKKTSFLRVLLSRLGLNGLWVVQGRWEEFDGADAPQAPGQYALITMRAVRLEPEHLTLLASRVLQPDGVFAWWAGPSAKSEWEHLAGTIQGSGMSFEGEFHYALPSIATPRSLLLWRNTGKSSNP